MRRSARRSAPGCCRSFSLRDGHLRAGDRPAATASSPGLLAGVRGAGRSGTPSRRGTRCSGSARGPARAPIADQQEATAIRYQSRRRPTKSVATCAPRTARCRSGEARHQVPPALVDHGRWSRVRRRVSAAASALGGSWPPRRRPAAAAGGVGGLAGRGAGRRLARRSAPTGRGARDRSRTAVPAAEERRPGQQRDHRLGEQEHHDHVDHRGQPQGEREAPDPADREHVEHHRGQQADRVGDQDGPPGPLPGHARPRRAASGRHGPRPGSVRSRR